MTATAQTKMRMVFPRPEWCLSTSESSCFARQDGRHARSGGEGAGAVCRPRDTVDLREFYLEIPKQTAITKDNALIAIDFITFFKVVDAEASVVQVADFAARARTRRRRFVPWWATSPSTTSSPNAKRSTRCCGRSSTRSPSAGASGHDGRDP